MKDIICGFKNGVIICLFIILFVSITKCSIKDKEIDKLRSDVNKVVSLERTVTNLVRVVREIIDDLKLLRIEYKLTMERRQK